MLFVHRLSRRVSCIVWLLSCVACRASAPVRPAETSQKPGDSAELAPAAAAADAASTVPATAEPAPAAPAPTEPTSAPSPSAASAAPAAASAAASAAGTQETSAPSSTGAQAPRSEPAAAAEAAAPANPAPEATAAPDPNLDYQIGPGDVLQIFVWREPELTREVKVRPDGKLTVPLIGDVMAAGATPKTLSEQLAGQLSKYLAAPQVSVGVSQASRLRFFVVGKVAKPGEYPLTGATTVLQALAVAGGLTEYAKSEAIVIVRQQVEVQPDGKRVLKETHIPFNFKKMSRTKAGPGNFMLAPGDTIVVP
jgi:polysaccharide export outer membrane protein